MLAVLDKTTWWEGKSLISNIQKQEAIRETQWSYRTVSFSVICLFGWKIVSIVFLCLVYLAWITLHLLRPAQQLFKTKTMVFIPSSAGMKHIPNRGISHISKFQGFQPSFFLSNLKESLPKGFGNSRLDCNF